MQIPFKAPLLMTPGPTEIHEDVLKASAYEITNPDLDGRFFELYKHVADNLKKIYKTENDIIILCGEGILGLEAACASLIEKNDRVLIIDNGVFGNGFGDFAKMYGANATYFTTDYDCPIDIHALENFLIDNHDFKLATLVHCETPSGITNPVNEICPLLKHYGILTVVDSVSALGGEPLETDLWKMDIVIGGSQKCLSASPGLTTISISPDAYHSIENRTSPIMGFYTNLTIWRNWYEKKSFPYTQPISSIMQLNTAVERFLADVQTMERHRQIAERTRMALKEAGIGLHPKSGFSNTVTAAFVPDATTFDSLFETLLQDHNIMIGGSIGYFKGKLFRIGHMGENCSDEKLLKTFKALDEVFRTLGVPLKASLHDSYKRLL